MQTACTGICISDKGLETLVTTHLKINDCSVSQQPQNGQQDYLCLVAGKVLYFGVGGGMADFLEAVSRVGGYAETVSEQKIGVGRKIIRLHWPQK